MYVKKSILGAGSKIFVDNEKKMRWCLLDKKCTDTMCYLDLLLPLNLMRKCF